MGISRTFCKERNVLNETLNYFYANVQNQTCSNTMYSVATISFRYIQISCFEIFVNTINDLLAVSGGTDAEEHISSHYAENLKAATQMLAKAFAKRKVGQGI